MPLEVEGEDGAEEFEVERILDKRVARNRVEYLVHRRGYSPERNTWEPLKNLGNARDLVSEFEQRRGAAREGKRVVKPTTRALRMKEDLEDFT